MITWLSKKHIRYTPDKKEVVLAYIAVGNASELPTKTGINGYVLHEASKAWDISTGDTYGFVDNGSDGVWNKQIVLVNPMILKGRVNTVNDLPANPEIGWMYMVGLSTDTEFQEYMYTADQRWEFIGYNTITIDSTLSDTSENPVQNKVITAALAGKQATLTLDQKPTASSTNFVNSGGIYSALAPISESDYESLPSYDLPVYFIYED